MRLEGLERLVRLGCLDERIVRLGCLDRLVRLWRLESLEFLTSRVCCGLPAFVQPFYLCVDAS